VAKATTLGVQPLHMAAQEGQVETARLLLQHGAPVGAVDRAGWSAFHYAANHRWATWRGDAAGQAAVLELLHAYGADVDCGDGEGYTCVHSAAQSGKVEMLRTLRRLGAAPNARTVRGVAPVHVAAEGGRAEAVEELLDWCPETVECEDFRGHRPLHHAAYHGHADVVEVLLRRGAEACPGPATRVSSDDDDDDDDDDAIRRRDRRRVTPLHLAARSGSLDAVVVLLAGGADPTRVDARGWTPRRLAAECAARELGAARDGGSGTADEALAALARARAAVDAVLERAEAGTPLLWSRAVHRRYPAQFQADAREVLRASWVATRGFRGLAADLVHDEVLRAGATNVWPREISPRTWSAVRRVRGAVEARWRDLEARKGRLARGVGLGMGLEFGGIEPSSAGGWVGRFAPREAWREASSEDDGDGAAAARRGARLDAPDAPAPGTPFGSAGDRDGGGGDRSVAESSVAMDASSSDEDEDEVQSAPPTSEQTAAAELEAEFGGLDERARQRRAMQRELYAMYETRYQFSARTLSAR